MISSCDVARLKIALNRRRGTHCLIAVATPTRRGQADGIASLQHILALRIDLVPVDYERTGRAPLAALDPKSRNDGAFGQE